MTYNWRLGGVRGPNALVANPSRLTSADGQRWATGRTVKRSLGMGRFDAVEVWRLVHRIGGQAVTVETGVDRADAELWVSEDWRRT